VDCKHFLILIIFLTFFKNIENITPMSHFHEQFYIAKHVLPELCTFAISKVFILILFKFFYILDARYFDDGCKTYL
jgi:hypothetical protein